MMTQCKPLNRLTWKDQAFQIDEVQQRGFLDIKKVIQVHQTMVY